MTKYGLLIDQKWCTGCHTCEVACQVEHDLPPDQSGIKLTHVGPWRIDENKWQDSFVPIPTEQCDTCAKRRSQGKLPTCVHHCQAKCMKFGTIEELSTDLGEDSKQVLFCL